VCVCVQTGSTPKVTRLVSMYVLLMTIYD